MNLTDFHDNSLLKLQVGGPFLGGMEAVQEAQEYILIQVEQTEEAGSRRRRTQQVRVVSTRADPESRKYISSFFKKKRNLLTTNF